MAAIQSNYADIAERYVIGAILIDNSTLSIAREMVKSDDFFSQANRTIFDCMCSLEDASEPINLATIFSRIGNDQSFVDKGGIDYLMTCEGETPSSVSIEKHANLIKTEATRRKLSFFSDTIKSLAAKPIDNIEATVANLSDQLLELGNSTCCRPWVDFRSAIQHATQAIITDNDAVIKSGFIDLDSMITGFRPGALTVIAARPAMGKTALGVNIMTHAAFVEKIPVAFFSLEMTADELVYRVLSSEASIDGNAIRRKVLSDCEWQRLLDAAEKLSSAKVYIDETAGIDIGRLKERALRMHRQYGIKLIIVDYLQLVTFSGKRAQTREQEVAAVSRGLKEIAKTINVPVIALAQLKRDVESRADKRPLMSDLRESGAIEQDADNVVFIHREDHYKQTGEKNNEAELIISKQRGGPTGIVKLHWSGAFTRFSNLYNEN